MGEGSQRCVIVVGQIKGNGCWHGRAGLPRENLTHLVHGLVVYDIVGRDIALDATIIPDRSPAAFQEERSAPVVEHTTAETDDAGRDPILSAANAPAAAPTDSRNPFIPRQPVTPAMISGEEDSATGGSDFSDFYDAAPAGGEPVRRRSLFERMTGVARTREPETIQPAAPRVDIETPPEPEIRISEPKPQPAPQPVHAETPPKPENPPAQASPTHDEVPKQEPKRRVRR